MVNDEETKEKIKELANKIKKSGNDIEAMLPFWKEIKELDLRGNYFALYVTVFESLINNIDSNSIEIVDIWNAANMELQRTHPHILEKVLDLVENDPEKCIDVWNSTPIKHQIFDRPEIIKKILRKTLEENREDKLRIFQGVFVHGKEIISELDTELIREAFKIFSHEDAFTAINSYKSISEDRREQIKDAIDIDALNERLRKEIHDEEYSHFLVGVYNEIMEAHKGGLPIDIEEYKKIIELRLKENPKEAITHFNSNYFRDTEEFNNTIIEMIVDLQRRGEDIPQINRSFTFSKDEFEKLLKDVEIERLPRGIEIVLKLKDISEFSSETLERAKNIIKKIQLGDNSFQTFSYEDLEASKAVINEFLKDVNLGNPDDPKRELKIFEQIIKKLGRHIKYNYKALRKEKKVENLNKKLRNPKTDAKQREKIKAKVAILDAEVGSLHIRDVVGGLVYGKAVCVGYAEIVKNVFACIGIEAREIGGTPGKNKIGHAWNQIKIDDIWYNLDLTWDRDLLFLGCPARWLLKSDKEFTNHNKYVVDRGKRVEKCETSVKKGDLNKYVINGFKTLKGKFKKPNRIKEWLKESLKSVNLKDVNRVVEKIEEHVLHKKEQEH